MALRLSEQLADGELDGYQEIASRFFERMEPSRALDWLESIEITAARAGLLLCNDLPLAMKLTRESDPLLGYTEREDIAQDLMRYSVSRDYEELRVRLGIN